MSGYKVEIESYCDHSEFSEEPYGSWSESFSNHLGKVSRSDQHPDAVSIVELKSGDRAFVVWAEWSSGDSFGNASRSDTEALAIFKESLDAYGLKNAINHPKGKGYHFKASTGQVFECGYAPWDRYFESLDGVHVEEVCVL